MARVYVPPTVKYPLLTVALLGTTFYWYYSGATRSAESAFNDRAFRALSAFAQQFGNQLGNYEAVARRSSRMTDAAFRQQGVGLERSAGCKSEPGKVRMEVVGSVAGYSLRFGYTRPPAEGGQTRAWRRASEVGFSYSRNMQAEDEFCRQASLEQMVGPFVESIPNGIFDDVLVAGMSGQVLYQSQRSGMKITDILALLSSEETSQISTKADARKSNGAAEPDQPARDGANVADRPPFRLGSSRLSDVRLGGERYKLYAVPILIPISGDQASSNSPSQSGFILGGILREQGFRRARTAPLGNTLITAGFIMLLIIVAAYPLLKFTLMSKTEPISRRAGMNYALLMLGTAALIAGVVGHLLFSNLDRTDLRLRAIAAAMTRNFETEVNLALDTVDRLENSPEFQRYGPADPAVLSKTCADSIVPFKVPDDGHWRAGILRNLPALAEYPYLDHIFWANAAGYQEIKWSARDSLTPVNRLCEYPAFRDLLAERLWHFENGRRAGRRFLIEPMYSGMTGKYLVFISRLAATAGNPAVRAATLATPLVSLSEPILPPDYGFAVIRASGEVMFHSVSTKNRRENFIYSCDRSERIRDLVNMRQAQLLTTGYLGVEHRMLVQPLSSLAGCDWSLVVFRDLSNWNSDHVDAVLLFTALAMLYFGFLSLVAYAALWLSISRQRGTPRPPDWIWPAEARRGTYLHIFAALFVVYIANVVFMVACGQSQLLWLGLTLPLVSAGIVVLKLTGREGALLWCAAGIWAFLLLTFVVTGAARDEQLWRAFLSMTFICAAFASLWFKRPAEWLNRFQSPSLATSYALPATVLLCIAGLMPAVAFFNAAFEFESVISARRAQLQLADQLERRAARIKREYWGVRVPGNPEGTGESVLLAKRRWEVTLDRYDRTFPPRMIQAEARPPERQSLQPLLESIAFSVLDYQAYVPVHRAGLREDPGADWVWMRDGPQRLVLERAGSGGSQAAGGAPGQAEFSDDGRVVRIVSTMPQMRDLAPRRSGAGRAAGSLAIWLALLGGALIQVRASVRNLFGLTCPKPKPWPVERLDPATLPRTNTIYVGVPYSGTTHAFRDRQDVCRIDLAEVALGKPVEMPAPDKRMIVLDHFAHSCDDADANRRKLNFIERLLVHGPDHTVVILSTIDPLYYLECRAANECGPGLEAWAPGREMDRWVTALARFRIVRASNESSCPPGYYRVLWSTCTWDERTVLRQLALSGWANHRQEQALLHLWQRGLLKREPMFLIRDEAFAQFVRESVSKADYAGIERRQLSSGWDSWRLVLLVCALAAAVAIAFAVGDQTVGIIATGVSGAATVAKVFASAKGKLGMGGDRVESA